MLEGGAALLYLCYYRAPLEKKLAQSAYSFFWLFFLANKFLRLLITIIIYSLVQKRIRCRSGYHGSAGD